MLTPSMNRLTMNVIVETIPCQKPAQNPAGFAPGSLYLEFEPATQRTFAIVPKRINSHQRQVQPLASRYQGEPANVHHRRVPTPDP